MKVFRHRGVKVLMHRRAPRRGWFVLWRRRGSAVFLTSLSMRDGRRRAIASIDQAARDDAEIERILSMTDAEVIAEAEAAGIDMAAEAAKCRAIFDRASAKAPRMISARIHESDQPGIPLLSGGFDHLSMSYLPPAHS